MPWRFMELVRVVVAGESSARQGGGVRDSVRIVRRRVRAVREGVGFMMGIVTCVIGLLFMS